MLARITKMIKGDVAEEHKALTKMHIHLFAIALCGLATYLLGPVFHVDESNAIVAAFGPFTPTMIQEFLDYMKGL